LKVWAAAGGRTRRRGYQPTVMPTMGALLEPAPTAAPPNFTGSSYLGMGGAGAARDGLRHSDRKFVNLGSKFRELLDGDFFIIVV
jgi:hypothetical protein